MTQQNRTWLWLIGCGVGLMGMMTCLVVFAAAALIIVLREESPTPIAEELPVATDTPAIEAVVPDTPLLIPDPALTVNRIVYIDRDGQIVTIAPDGT